MGAALRGTNVPRKLAESFQESSCSMTETQKKVALITGITGQDGSYLAELLLERV